MSLHYLDPPRAMEPGAKPDVETWATWTTKTGERSAFRYGPPCDQDETVRPIGIAQRTYPTEREALHAARVAAGFGHVAERPCNSVEAYDDGHGDCCQCAWPMVAHGKES